MSRAHETNNGGQNLNVPMAGDNDGTERGGGSQGVSDLRCRSQGNSDCKIGQISLQPHMLPEFKNKQTSRCGNLANEYILLALFSAMLSYSS